MPGIIGYISQNDLDEDKPLISVMARQLESDCRFKADVFRSENFALGSVRLKGLNEIEQPVWNETRSLCLVMEGEVYDYQDLKQDLISRGHKFNTDSDAEFLLHLYEEYGERFLKLINGAFVLAIWDQINRCLLLANDHLGQRPLYYSIYNRGLYFASGLRALLADESLTRTIDKIAVVQFLALGHVLDDRTFLQEVKMLPPASLLVYSSEHFHIQNYWQISYPDTYPIRSGNEYLHELMHLLQQAVRRQVAGIKKSGILLSGGIDSRLVLGLLSEQMHAEDLISFTWGIPDCDDERYARQVSSRLGVHHQFNKLNPTFLLDLGEEGIRITDGFANIVNIHALANLEHLSNHVAIVFKGYLGDALMGFYVNRHMLGNIMHDDLVDYILFHDPTFYPLVFTLDELSNLLSKEFWDEVAPDRSLYQTIKTLLKKSGAYFAADMISHFDLTQRQRRLTLNGVEVVRSWANVRTPYCDKDLVEYMVKISPGYRYERYLQKQTLVEYFPALSSLPVSGSQLPLRESARTLTRKAHEFFRWHLYKRGIINTPYIQCHPYANYDEWFRSGMREWMESILLGTRSVERGYFNFDYIRSLVQELLQGASQSVKIGSLISLELMQRLLLD